MELQALHQKIRAVAQGLFLCAFVLVAAVACGEFEAAKPTAKTGGAQITSTGGAVSALESISIDIPHVQGLESGDGIEYLITTTVNDGGQKVYFFVYSNAVGVGDATTAGNGTESGQGRTYNLEGQCNDSLCKTFAVLLSVLDDKTGKVRKEAVVYSYDYVSGRVTEQRRFQSAQLEQTDSVSQILLSLSGKTNQE